MSSKHFQSIIKQHIENLLSFLEPLLHLANCHMVDFFTDSAYINSVPNEMQQEIERIGKKNITNLIFKSDYDQTPVLKEFVENSTKFTLKNCDICLSIDDFVNKLQSWGCDNVDKFKLEIFMSAKKSHEVEILSGVTAAVARISNVSHIVDIGDGKGYLSSMLALHHQIPVLGIDASNINTCGAIKRVNKLSKVWKGVTTAPKKSYPAKNDNTSSDNVNFYKQVTLFVDENTDLKQIVADTFTLNPLNSLRLGIVGLHTCGNLSPNSLKIFCKNDNIKLICNIGCCYHLLDEKFGKTNVECGFPLSKFLTDKNIVIGRSARMIANQSVERILETKELPNITIYYRALLQVILEQYCITLPTKHVGKFRKLPQNFVEYARTAMKRIDVDLDISDEKIAEFHSHHESRIDELNLFYLLRCRLAPVIETLILLDRLLYLHELGVTNSFLVQFFDPVVSPRCYGIVAIKE